MERRMIATPPAYVLGSSLNALGVIRCLGRRRIQVRAVQKRKDEVTARSRYNSPILVEPKATEAELLELLVTAARRDGSTAVLIPTGDVDVAFMSNNQDVLRKYFQFVLSDASVLDALLKKDAFYRLALNMNLLVPKTFFARNSEEVQEISRQITFPCVIKPRYSPAWQHPRVAKALGYAKILECCSPEELMSQYGSLEIEAREVVIQEMIPGGEENLHDVYVYMGPGGIPVASFALQKLRTEPIAGRGGGTLVRSIHHPELAETALSFLQAIGYRGPAAVCFKQDAQTKQFMVIEVNARLSLHHSLAARCGIDFAHLLYLDSVCETLSPKFNYSGGVKWIAALGDARVFPDYRKECGLSYRNWLLSYRGPKTFGDWSWDDPWPFVRQSMALLPSAARKIWFRTYRAALPSGLHRRT